LSFVFLSFVMFFFAFFVCFLLLCSFFIIATGNESGQSQAEQALCAGTQSEAGAERGVWQDADRRSAVRCSVPAADGSGRHVAGGGVTGHTGDAKGSGDGKKQRRQKRLWWLGLKKDGKKHRDQQQNNEISTPIQPQHLSNESARLKRVDGTR
jgi:hypothetical protein